MLGKLIKYELKSTSRIFLPMFAILIIASIFTRFSVSEETMTTLGMISTTIVVCMFVAVGVATLIWTVQRFNKNLLQDEGYLMFTLPVKSSTLINAKLISAMLWYIVASFVAAIAVSIIFLNGEIIREALNYWPQIWQIFAENLGANIVDIIQFIIFSILSLSSFLLSVYCSLSIGQLPIFQKARMIFSFLAFIVISVLTETIVLLIARFTGLFDWSYKTLMNFYNSSGYNLTPLIPIVGMLILSVALFYITKLILDNKLNLE